ncbi:sulfatase [Micromonospora maritima]|uniref:Sulfatase n=1 Tax=Micromonospora maritima TaxID=986711 RepID=A0ABW7ZFU8_9ACTN
MEQPNIIFISLDTVRADVAYSGKMPGIERLRRQGTTFLQAVSSCPLTPVSHATVFTGLQPPNHGIRHLFREQLRADVPTLAALLKSAGYATGAVVSCPGLNTWYGINRGFDFYDDEIPKLPDGRDPLSVGDVKLRGLALKRAPLVVDRATEWLSRQESPFFLFAHFFDAHWPYEPPEDVNPDVANPYEGEVAYSDHYLQLLLSRIEQMGHDLSSTIVVCFSDHGEDLGGWYPNDHAGDRGHPEEEGHGCLLFDATQHVPLIIGAPGVPGGGEVHSQVRLVDIMPTVLEMLGLSSPPSDGSSLVEFFKGDTGVSRPAYSETFFPEEKRVASGYSHLQPLGSVRLDEPGRQRQKIIWAQGGSDVEVFDLVADPDEMNGLSMTGAPTVTATHISSADGA